MQVSSSEAAPALLASIATVLEKWGPHYQGEHAFMVQLARSSRYWRHSSSVATPTLLLAGADDSEFLLGMDNLASIVPRARIIHAHGVSHMPQVEAPAWYRAHVDSFVQAQGFRPRA